MNQQNSLSNATRTTIANGHRIDMLQRDDELVPFCTWLSGFTIANYLEIGTYTGASFAVWDSLSGPGIHISLDPNTETGIILPPEKLAARRALFAQLKPTIHELFMDSTDPRTLKAVRAILGTQPLDFLFIDGDHHFRAVWSDYILYGQLVRPEGIIAFHDAILYPDVRRAWNIIQHHHSALHLFAGNDRPWGITAIVKT